MIRSLTLRDFKSFGEVEVPLGTFSLIVGTNASGKSNLRDALRFLHGVGLGFTIAEIFGEKYGPGGILQWRGIRGGLPEAIRQGERSFEIGFEADSCERGTILYEPDANAPHSSISDEMKCASPPTLVRSSWGIEGKTSPRFCRPSVEILLAKPRFSSGSAP